jgi:hypothetical protein
MLRKFTYTIFLIFVALFSYTQENKINEYTTIKYNHDFSWGPLIHTNGIGVGFKYSFPIRYNIGMNAVLDIMNLKHPKETKVLNPIFQNARPYVYGKTNTVIPIKFGIGNQFIISDKEIINGIRLTFNYAVGFNFSLLKPEYLVFLIKDPITGKYNNQIERFNPDNTAHSNQANIFGGTSFFSGITELSATTGFFGKVILGFEWGEDEERYHLLETGIMLDAYPEPLPIFAYLTNKQLFLNLFINLNFGTRW